MGKVEFLQGLEMEKEEERKWGFGAYLNLYSVGFSGLKCDVTH